MQMLQVVVIDNGKIVEQGTHESLLAENGVYRALVLRQLTSANSSGEFELQSDELQDRDIAVKHSVDSLNALASGNEKVLLPSGGDDFQSSHVEKLK